MVFDDDIKATQAKLERLNKKAVPKATAQAINRVAVKVMNKSIAETSKAVDVPKRLIKGRARLEKAKPSRLSAFIKVNRGNLPVIRLIKDGANPVAARGKHRGQLRAGKRYYDRAFIQRLANGRVQVMQRQGRERYPIDVVKIPLVKPLTEAFMSQANKALKDDMPKEMRMALQRQIQLVVKR